MGASSDEARSPQRRVRGDPCHYWKQAGIGQKNIYSEHSIRHEVPDHGVSRPIFVFGLISSRIPKGGRRTCHVSIAWFIPHQNAIACNCSRSLTLSLSLSRARYLPQSFLNVDFCRQQFRERNQTLPSDFCRGPTAQLHDRATMHVPRDSRYSTPCAAMTCKNLGTVRHIFVCEPKSS
jgi:hypothetical protein